MGIQSTKDSFNGTFELADNFSSCCQLRGRTPVYVNKYYEIEKFDNRKSHNPEQDHLQSKKKNTKSYARLFAWVCKFS